MIRGRDHILFWFGLSGSSPRVTIAWPSFALGYWPRRARRSQRGQGDVLGVDLEKPPQIGPGLAPPETVGAQHGVVESDPGGQRNGTALT